LNMKREKLPPALQKLLLREFKSTPHLQ
jgi:hypothetical protein